MLDMVSRSSPLSQYQAWYNMDVAFKFKNGFIGVIPKDVAKIYEARGLGEIVKEKKEDKKEE